MEETEKVILLVGVEVNRTRRVVLLGLVQLRVVIPVIGVHVNEVKVVVGLICMVR